jgi:hypothetical protein
MTLTEGATNEINSRWPEHKQRNCGLMPDIYGIEYRDNMTIGIQLVRDRYHQLKGNGATSWSTTQALRDMLDDLAGI